MYKHPFPVVCLPSLAISALLSKPGPRYRVTRREAGQQAVPFATAFVFVVILAETDDARAPHFRRLPRDVLHELDEFMAVFAFLFIVHLFDECGRNPLKRQLSNGCCALFNGLGATTK